MSVNSFCKGYILYDSSDVTFAKRQNYKDRVKRSVIARALGGTRAGMNWGEQRTLGCDMILCDTVTVDTRHYAFVKTHRTVQQ